MTILRSVLGQNPVLGVFLRIFFSRLIETNGPFFNDLAIFYYFFLRSIINLLLALFFDRVLNPFAGIPFLDLG